MSPRVLHLVGSPVDERLAELSRLYARGCLAATADRAEAQIAHVEVGGRWRFPAALHDDALAAAPACDVAEAIARIDAAGFDAVVPQMFCRPGMVEYRALFDVLGVPLLGNPAATMALAADKPRARAVVAAAGVAVPDGVVVHSPDEVPGGLVGPIVVKPADADNSDGVSLVRSRDQLDAAIAAAIAASGPAAGAGAGAGALVERYVPLGREVRCGVLQRDGERVVLPLEEYAVSEAAKPIRDGADKLARDEAGELGLVAKDAAHAWIVDPGDPVGPAVAAAALACFDALGCRDYGLFDFRIDPDGRPWFLEAGLYCSFSPASVVAVMARAAGIEVGALFDTVLHQALRRKAHRAPLPA